MFRSKFFIIASAIIFIVERILQSAVYWPVLIFPIFAVLFILVNSDDATGLFFVAGASIVFDFFSGFKLGVFTLAILAAYLLAHLFKKYFNVNPKSLPSLFLFSVICVLAFAALLSLGYSLGSLVSEAKAILAETAVLSLLMLALIKIKPFYFNDSR